MSRKTRKLIWSVPLVAALAIVGALAIFVALAPNDAAAHEAAMHGAPGPVTGLDATTYADDDATPEIEDQTMIMLSWYAPGDTDGDPATSYRIDYSKDTRVWHALEDMVGDTMADANCGSDAMATMRCYTAMELDPDTTYYFRVFAMNAFGISPVSVNPTYAFDDTDPVEAPSAALNLTATKNMEEQINLDWSMPYADGGADIVWYCINVAAAPSGAFSNLADGTAQLAAHDNATAGTICHNATEATDYDDVETAINGLAAGSPTDAVTIVVPATDTMYMHMGLDDPDIIELQYRVYAVTDEDGDPEDVGMRRAALAASNSATGRTVADRQKFDDPLGKPTAVQNLRAVAYVSDQSPVDGTPTMPQLRLFWNAPEGVDEYPDNWNLEVHKWATTATDDDFDWREVSGDAPQTGQPTDNAAAQFNVTQGANGNLTSLTEGNPRSEQYRIRYVIDPDMMRGNSDDVDGARRVVNVALPLAVVTGGTDSREDRLPLLEKANANGNEFTDVANPTDAELIEAMNLRFRHNPSSPKTAIDLMWQRNENMGAEDENIPTGYVIDVSEDEGTTWLRLANADEPSDLGATTQYTHQGVEPGKQYTYRVFPWHKNAFGHPVMIDASSRKADLPDPVRRRLKVEADGETKLKLTWPAVTVDGGHDIMGYLVQVSQDQNNDATNDNLNEVTGWVSLDVTLNQQAPDDDANNDPDNDPITVDADTLMYTYDGSVDHRGSTAGVDPLTAGAARWFRVIPITYENDGVESTGGAKVNVDTGVVIVTPSDGEASPNEKDITAADEVRGETAGAPDPDAETDPPAPPAPADVTAEKATDANRFALTDLGVLLLWNEPKDGEDITGYDIDRKIGSGEWEIIGAIRWSGDMNPDERTSFTDDREPVAGEDLYYRVGSRSTSAGDPTWAMPIMYPAVHPEGHIQGALTAVDGLSATAGSTTGTAEVSWTSGANATMHWIYAIRADEMEGGYKFEQTSSSNSHTLRGLDSGVEYIVGVSAGRGQLPGGEWSAWMFTRVTPD